MPLAAVLKSPQTPIEIQEFSHPQLEQGGVLLETIYSEVCGTDVHLMHGRLAGVPYPIIPGHVSVGRVLETAGKVTDISGKQINPGAQVTFLDVHETCNHCWFCLVAKTTTRCPQRKVYGITYSAAEGLLGGWSEQIYLKPGVKILSLPEAITPEQLIAGGCALPTAIHAIDRGEIRIGETVVVQGCGPVGLNAALLAMISGATTVIAIDSNQNRLQMAASLGVDQTVMFDAQDPQQHIDQVLQLTAGRGADLTIEATGSPSAIKPGIAMTRDGGRYVIVGHYTDTGEVTLNPHQEINRKHLDIRGSWGSDFSHFYRMLQILARHGTKWEPMISQIYSLSEVSQALAAVESGSVIKALIEPNSVKT